jgi:hypothetical protein
VHVTCYSNVWHARSEPRHGTEAMQITSGLQSVRTIVIWLVPVRLWSLLFSCSARSLHTFATMANIGPCELGDDTMVGLPSDQVSSRPRWFAYQAIVLAYGTRNTIVLDTHAVWKPCSKDLPLPIDSQQADGSCWLSAKLLSRMLKPRCFSRDGASRCSV